MRREVKIGIFAVVILLSAWAGIRFLSGLDLFSRTRVYYASYDNVSGVQMATPIYIRGVKVGTVTGISFDPEKSDDVVLALSVRRQYDIPSDTEAKLFSDGIMGGKAVELLLGRSSQMLKSGDEILTRQEPDLMAVAGGELQGLSSKITALADELSQTLSGINALVKDNAESISGTMTHLNSISGNLDSVLASERESLRAAIKSLSEFSSALGENSAQIDSMLTGLGRFSTELADSHIAESLAVTAKELNALLESLNSGEGSMGKLFSDEALYDSLAEATDNLSALLADLKERPMRYVHFSVFGKSEEKLDKRADKEAAKEAERHKRDSLRMVGAQL